MSKLLIDDYPIQVLPKLAVEVGLNEAIFLQQLHYWLNSKSAKMKDGKKWVYNTYEDWQEQFPFWSVSTIKRTISSLEKQKMIYKGNYNRAGFDKTVWYSVNYIELKRVSQRLGQNEPTSGSNWTDGEGQIEPTNTIDYTETTSETTKDIVGQPDRAPYVEVIDYLNHKTGKQYRSTTKATQRIIKARFREGFTLEEFKKVIDNKTADWLKDTKMSEYLRPQTLFGAEKFEGYLNQKSKAKQAPADDRYDLKHLVGREIDERNTGDVAAAFNENEYDNFI